MKKIYSSVKAVTAFLGLAFGFAAHAQPSYCNTNLGGSYCGDHITNVTIVGTTFNNSSGCTVTGNGDTYSAYAPALGTTETLSVGLVYTISITTDANNIESFWIDFNQDGTFANTEWVQPTLNSTPNAATTATVLIPLNSTFGLTGFRIRSRGTGNQNGANDACTYFGSGETEDYVITIAPGVPCQATPAANTVVATQTLICPVFGTAGLSLANSYTVGAINYIWYQSANALGPWNAIPSATMTGYTTPNLTGTTFYMLTAQCMNGGVTMSATPVQIDVASTTTNTVPYYESFEGITVNKQLPNCSWFRSDNYQCGSRTAMVSSWRQARTGTKFAEFDASDYNYYQTQYFYSNGILLNAGITYSASVWYNTIGYSQWYDFTLAYGPNQSPAGLTTLDSEQNPSNTSYQSLSNTFQVPTTGMYYIAVRASENGYGSQMVWDDLSVIAPCSFTNNAANITVAGASTLCAGQTININASGASTYTWNTGSNANSISVSPLSNTVYVVNGTNPLSNCLGSTTKAVSVFQKPPVVIYSDKSSVCEGKSIKLTGMGADSFTWSAGPTFDQDVIVTPTANNNTYILVGKDALGCTKTVTRTITINPAPVVSVSGQTMICEGAIAELSATGGGANGVYVWKSNKDYVESNSIALPLNVTTIFTVTATDANECKGSYVMVVAVDPCLGLQDINGSASRVTVYPNPNNGIFSVVKANGLNKTVEVMDVTGRIIVSATSAANTVDMNISALSNGVYYVKVKSEDSTEVIKIVKQ